MAKGTTLKVIFKETRQHQSMLLPPSLDDLIAANHPVPIVNEVLERVDFTGLVKHISRAAPAAIIHGCY